VDDITDYYDNLLEQEIKQCVTCVVIVQILFGFVYLSVSIFIVEPMHVMWGRERERDV
jgi:hypothetical protein